MPQEQRDREQAWVMARGQAGHTADERVEVVADVKFFEQRLQQLARQHKTAHAFRQGAKVIEAAVSSPVVNVVDVDQPGR